MHVHCELLVLMLLLTLGGQGHTGEIIGGHEAEPHSRPYMVLLERTMKDGKQKFCDGFLLNEGFVLTAAHCQAESYKAVLGVHNSNKRNGTQSIHVKQDFPHEGYNDITYANDIMLLKLSSHPHFNKRVETIDLACKGDSLSKPCFVSGWGKTGKNEKYLSLVLMEVNVTLTPECFKEDSYCSKGDSGPAQGDSGSPLVCRDGKAYGVVSGSRANTNVCAYSSVPDYRDWIDWVIKNN